jgi:16S rRNA processing protein RimM
VIEDIMETGANDVLVVAGDRQRLIPYVVDDVVKHVDLQSGTMTVDWEPDY